MTSPNASGDSRRFKSSTKNSESGPPNSRPLTMNWRPSLTISHDLRAPLRHMAGFTELLQKSTASILNERNQRHVKMILESVQRMGELIDDLLAFSRISRAETHKTL